jgi:uncharacterized cupin superfamily protein
VVQTIEGTPAFVHGGPFANIAHGTNSLIADDVASKLSDYLVTEAGFGSDLGAEKFMNVVCRLGDIQPSAVTLVASVRALKYHGQEMWPPDFDALDEPDVEAVRAGFENLDKHVRNLQKFGVPVVVALNRFPDDTDAEVQAVLEHCREDLGIEAAESTVFEEGGAGGVDLAEKLMAAIEDNDQQFRHLYDLEDSIAEKIETIATEIYGAESVTFQSGARDDIERMERLGFDDVPVVMSKTFHSLSDNAEWKGAPTGWSRSPATCSPCRGCPRTRPPRTWTSTRTAPSPGCSDTPVSTPLRFDARFFPGRRRVARMGENADYAVVAPGDVEREPFPESGIGHRKLTAALGCTDTRVNSVTLDPGEATAPHGHERQEEIYVALDGGTVVLDGESHRVPEGGVVRIGPEANRSVRNDGDAPQRWLMVGAPPHGAVDDFGEYRMPDGG